MNTQVREYRQAARSLLRGRGFTFVVLLTFGVGAGSVAAVSQVGNAVLRPVTHVLGMTKRSEECSHDNARALKRQPARTRAALVPPQPNIAEPQNDPSAA